MKKYKAIIFDADGTLVNTTNLVIKGFQQVLIEFGHQSLASESYIRNHIGGPVEHCYGRMLSIDETSTKVQNLTKRHDEVQDAHPEWICEYPTVRETLLSLRKNGLKIGLFTSGSDYHVLRNFKAIGIDLVQTFDSVVTADDGYKHKPSPDGLLGIIKQIGESNTSDCIFVGDHGVDMIAGKNARCGMTIGISHGFHSENELTDAGADRIIHRLDELLGLLW